MADPIKEEVTAEVKTKMVEVPQSTLDQILARDKERDAKIAELEEKLNATGDRHRIQRFDEGKAKPKNKIVTVATYGGQIVTGWGNMPKNLAQKNQNNVWVEDLQTEIWLIDGTKQIIPYVDFDKQTVPINAEIIKRTTDSDGLEILHLLTESGVELDIDVKFINK